MISKTIARITMAFPVLSPLALTALILLGLSSGCTSAAKYNELATEHELVQSILERTSGQLGHERRALREARLQNFRLTKDLQQEGKENRTLVKKIAVLETEKSALETKFHENFSALNKLEEKHVKIHGMAQETFEELSALRQRHDSLVDDRKRLEEKRIKQRKQLAGLTAEVDNLRIELDKAQVAARVSQEQNAKSEVTESAETETQNKGPAEVVGTPQSQLASLSEEVVNSQGGLSSANDGQSAATADSIVDPTTLYESGKEFLLGRYNSALSGEIAWDTFDTAVVSTLGAAVVLLILSFLFVIRHFRARRRLNQLEVYVDEIEQEEYAYAGEDNAAQPETEKTYPAPAPLPPEPRLPRRPSPAPVDTWKGEEEDRLLPNEFSGIMRSRGVKQADTVESLFHESQILPSSAGPQQQTVPAPQQTVPVAANSPKGSRRVIGAGTWQDEITNPSETIGQTPPAQEIALGAVFDEETGAQTQIIPDVDLALIRDGSGGDDKAKTDSKSSCDDQELLSELKSIINKKFDTAMEAERE